MCRAPPAACPARRQPERQLASAWLPPTTRWSGSRKSEPTSRSLQGPVDRFARHQQLLDRVDADLEIGLGGVVELNLDDPFDAFRADHHGNPDVEVVDAVLASEM